MNRRTTRTLYPLRGERDEGDATGLSCRNASTVYYGMRGLFTESKVLNLPRICSDHHPIAFNSDFTTPPCRDSRPFRFEAAWFTHLDFQTVFKTAWEQHADSLPSAIESVRGAIKEEHFCQKKEAPKTAAIGAIFCTLWLFPKL